MNDLILSNYHYISPFLGEEGTKRTRSWVFLIYPEWGDDVFAQIMLRVRSVNCIFVLSPLHQDMENIYSCDDKGHPICDTEHIIDTQVMKDHYHMLVIFPNPRFRNAVAKLLSIPFNNLLQPCSDVDGTIRYFIHLGWDKRQYNKNDIITNNIPLVERALRTDMNTDTLIQLQMLKQAIYTLNFENEFDLCMFIEENNLQKIYGRYHWAISKCFFDSKGKFIDNGNSLRE